MNLLGVALYDPAAAVSKSTASLLALTAVDTANLRLTVTVPAHGFLTFRLSCAVVGATTFPSILLGVLKGATVVGRKVATIFQGTASGATAIGKVEAEITVGGLTAGATVYDAAYAVQVIVASTNIKYGGPNDATGNDAWGAFEFSIWDPQPVPSAAPGAANGLHINGSNAGTTTFGALTVTGTVTISDGLIVNRSSANATAVTFTGNGTGNGLICISGSGASGDGAQFTCNATGNGNGITLQGKGSGHGLKTTGGAAFTTTAGGHGISATGGASSTGVGGVAGNAFNMTGGAGSASQNGSGAAFVITAGGTTTVAGNVAMVVTGAGNFSGATFDSGSGGTSGDGITATSHATAGNGGGIGTSGAGSGPGIGSKGGATGHGFHANGGNTSGDGLHCSGNGTGNALGITTTGGDAVVISPTAGHGINVTANGTSKHGILSTGAGAGVSDGMKLVAGTGGVDFRGNITGTISGLTFKKNQALNAFEFYMIDSTDHRSGKTGLGAGVTCQRSIDGAAFGACTNAAAEVSNGFYKLDLSAADMNGNVISLMFTGTGADPLLLTIVTQP